MLFINATEENQRRTVVDNLIKESKTSGSYFFMLGISGVIATLGLLTDNFSVVLGAMLITPLLTPILALGLAITTLSPGAIFRSTLGIVNSISTIIFISFLIGLGIGSSYVKTAELVLRGTYSHYYLVIAFFSGLGATYAWIEHRISYALTGVAVAVSLLPPLSVIGLAISQADTPLFVSATRLFAANFAGIVFASTIMFTVFNFTKLKKYEEKKIKVED